MVVRKEGICYNTLWDKHMQMDFENCICESEQKTKAERNFFLLLKKKYRVTEPDTRQGVKIYEKETGNDFIDDGSKCIPSYRLREKE